jgi:hypothetical protein
MSGWTHRRHDNGRADGRHNDWWRRRRRKGRWRYRWDHNNRRRRHRWYNHYCRRRRHNGREKCIYCRTSDSEWDCCQRYGWENLLPILFASGGHIQSSSTSMQWQPARVLEAITARLKAGRPTSRVMLAHSLRTCTGSNTSFGLTGWMASTFHLKGFGWDGFVEESGSSDSGDSCQDSVEVGKAGMFAEKPALKMRSVLCE